MTSVIFRPARAAAVVLAGVLFTAAASAEPIDLKAGGRVQQQFDNAIAHLASGNLTQAEAALQALLKEDPSHVYAQLASAQVAVNQGRLAAAERGVAAALQRQEKMPEAHNMRGVVLLMQRRTDEAAESFKRALEIRPDYVTPRFYLAAIARSKGNYAATVKEYHALALSAPKLPAGYLGQAEAYMMLRKSAEAVRVLELWKSMPGSGNTPYHVIANIFLVEGNPAKAIQELQAALAKSPGDSAALTYLGDAYVASKDLTKARDSYRLAVKADPKNAVATNNLAWLLMDQARDLTALNESLALAEAAVKLEPTYVDALDTLGWVHYRRADYANSIISLAKARKIAPGRMDIAAHLGLAYAKAGKKTEALVELRAALASKASIANRDELERAVKELGAAQ